MIHAGMPKKALPVVFTPGSAEKLHELCGNDFAEIEISVQMLLSRRPRHGAVFENDLRAIKLSTPQGDIVIAYEFDEEAVYIVKVIGKAAQSAKA